MELKQRILKKMDEGWSYPMACKFEGLTGLTIYTIRHSDREFDQAVGKKLQHGFSRTRCYTVENAGPSPLPENYGQSLDLPTGKE